MYLEERRTKAQDCSGVRGKEEIKLERRRWLKTCNHSKESGILY